MNRQQYIVVVQAIQVLPTQEKGSCRSYWYS